MLHKVVLVTGSSSGIGEATALRFAKLGCKVIVHGTDAARIEQVANKCASISPEGLKPLCVRADMRNENDIRRIMSEVITRHSKLDVLVNNAGLFEPIDVESPDAYAKYKNLMNINMDSVVLLTSLAIPHLKSSKGCIVNISTNLHSKPIQRGFAYSAAKAALLMYTKSIAVDLAPHIRVNSVSPGPIASLMSTRCGMQVDTYRKLVGDACLVNRVGEPDEVARVVEFLACPESAFITGSDFIVDGGATIKPSGKVMGEE